MLAFLGTMATFHLESLVLIDYPWSYLFDMDMNNPILTEFELDVYQMFLLVPFVYAIGFIWAWIWIEAGNCPLDGTIIGSWGFLSSASPCAKVHFSPNLQNPSVELWKFSNLYQTICIWLFWNYYRMLLRQLGLSFYSSPVLHIGKGEADNQWDLLTSVIDLSSILLWAKWHLVPKWQVPLVSKWRHIIVLYLTFTFIEGCLGCMFGGIPYPMDG